MLGVILLILFVYFGVTISRKTETKSNNTTQETPQPNKQENIPFILVKFIAGVALIIFLSTVAVDSSTEIAEFIGLPSAIVGATVIGLGTSLPELATTIQALKQKLYSMALGSLMGSCITNITLILGVASLLSASEVNVVAVQSIMFYVLLSSLSVWFMIGSNEKLTKKGAIFLCLIYVAFILQQVGVSLVIF
jgi:cation:H+ antiporter